MIGRRRRQARKVAKLARAFATIEDQARTVRPPARRPSRIGAST